MFATESIWIVGQGLGGFAAVAIVIGGVLGIGWRLARRSLLAEVKEDVATIKKKITPNGGETMEVGDIVQRIEKKLDEFGNRLEKVEAKVG